MTTFMTYFFLFCILSSSKFQHLLIRELFFCVVIFHETILHKLNRAHTYTYFVTFVFWYETHKDLPGNRYGVVFGAGSQYAALIDGYAPLGLSLHAAVFDADDILDDCFVLLFILYLNVFIEIFRLVSEFCVWYFLLLLLLLYYLL